MREDPRPSRWKSPWLWIGLSCGVLILGVGLIVLASLIPLASYYRPGGARERIRNEPVLLFAEMAARKDPNVKVVSRDTKRHTVSLRNRKTGERFVLGQTGEKKLRIQTEAGEVTLDIKPLPDWTLWLGSAADPLPSWIPAPPGLRPRPLYKLRSGQVVSGCSLLLPSGPAEDVFAFYRGELEGKGFKLVPGDSFSASSPDYSSSIFIGPPVQKVQKGRPRLFLTWSKMSGPKMGGNR